jgi:cell division septation protein DedD
VDVAMPPPRPEIPVRVAALEPATPADPEPVATASAASEPATLPASDPAPATAAKGGFVVQIAAAKSSSEAQSTLRAAQRRFAVLLEGQPTSIKRVELEGKGTFYRVRVGPLDTRDAAISLCTSLKSAGGDCVVAKN